MSNSNEASLPFIKLSMSPNEFHQQMPNLLDYAKRQGVHEYVTGTQQVKSQAELASLNQTKLSIYCQALSDQMVKEEKDHAEAVYKRMVSNSLYAYLYKKPIPAVDPIRPTQAEVDAARVRILYNQESYEAYLTDKAELIKAPGTAARHTQCQGIRPSPSYIGYGGNDENETFAAELELRIRAHEYEEIAAHDAKITPTIQRYYPGDDDSEVLAKLSSSNKGHAIDAYSKSSKLYDAERTRINKLHAVILTFFQDSIEGVQHTAAAQHIKNRDWHLVLAAISKAYGGTKSPPAAAMLQASFASITMSPTDTVYVFMDRVQTLLANIHVTFEALDEVPAENRLSFEQVYLACLYDEQQWYHTYPNNPVYNKHSVILVRLLDAITQSRLKQVAFLYNNNFTARADRTIQRLVDAMVTGEAALPLNEQVTHQVSAVTTSSTTEKVPKFCAFHSHNGMVTYHTTEECKSVSKGLTKQDSNNAKWLVWKDSGLHYTPQAATTGKKRPNDAKDKSSKKKGKKGPCSICKELIAGGESIPAYVMKNHHADDCRIKQHSKNSSNKNSKSSNSEGDGDKSSKPKSSIPLTKKQVAQVVQALSLTAKKFMKKHGKKDPESSDDDDSDSS